MPSFEALRRTIFAINFIAPLVPVLAVVMHGRATGRYRTQPWMSRLSVLLVFILIEDWTMLGTAMNGIHNPWLADLWFLPEVLLMAWAINGVGSRPVSNPTLGLAALAVVLGVAWEAAHTGLRTRWAVTGTVSSLLLLCLCLWQLFALIVQTEAGSPWRDPAYWFLGAWSLLLIMDLTFFPLYGLFLRSLSRTWILLPWLGKSIFGLVLNLGLARTYLCPIPSSS